MVTDMPGAIANHPVTELLTLSRQLAWGASKILRAYYRGETEQDGVALDLDVKEKKDGPVTAADLAVNHYVLQHLKDALGEETFGYLSEETYKAQADAKPFPQDWVWILDPLDGTRDFIDQTGEYAFHLALTYQGRPMLTVVACPEAERVYFASKGNGAFVETADGNVQPLTVSASDRPEDLTIVASRTHRDERFNHLLASLPCKDKLYVGSVGGKIAAIVDGRAEVYLSLSGKSAPKDWDMAAPELILTEAGGQFTHFSGEPLQYNTGDVNQWGGLMASNGHCHNTLCTIANDVLAAYDQAAQS
ncbi:3'(2'),5'-bisphosphate nucleotidase CysQ family protein [Vacuolonema iberomarrocanum]|uniref:3'(2'),5'-bisphosphate nucleotidase CysQ family protein n=1 Tax=Vacuolonema iberomarrocanum TaxID=3454632 RepID=UPI003F6DAB9B